MADLKRRIIAEFSAKNKAKGEMAGFRRDMDKTGEAMRRMAKGALVAAAGIAGGFYVAKRGFDYVTKAAMKQEDALFLLEAALKAAGEYAAKTMEGFEAFAASIQKATIYGDEEVLALMQLMKSLGVTSSGLEQATRMAIGLAAATGRDVKSMSMYIALAQQGEFTMLRRYIPALRKTTDATEQLQIITEFCARGFKIAEAQAETASGSLKQMWNAVGDLAEAMGKPFLDTMAKDADNLKTAIEGSTKAVEEWEEVITSDFVKPLNQKIYPALKVIIKTCGYLVSGIHTVRAAFTQLSGGAFVASGGIIVAFGEIESALEKLNNFAAKSWLGKKLDLPVREEGPKISAWGKALIEQGRALDKAASEMMQDLPSLKIAEGFKKFDKVIEESRAPPEKLTIKEQYEEVLRKKMDMIDEELAANKKKIDALKSTEGFFLRETTEAHREAAIEIDKVWTQMWLKEEKAAYQAMRAPIIAAEEEAREHVEFVRAQDYMTREQRIRSLKIYKEKHQETLDLVLEAEKIIATEIKKLERDKWEALRQWGTDASDVYMNLDRIAVSALDGMADALTELCSTGKADFKALARAVISDITRMMIKMQMMQALGAIFPGLVPGGGGGPNIGQILWSGFTGSFAPGPTPAAAEASYIAASGAAWTVPAQHGGVFTRPTLVRAGEVPEAFVPLSGGRNIPVEMRGGGGGGNLDVHIHNEGEGKFEISEVEEYAISDQRIIDVTIRAAGTHGPYRRSIRQASR